MKHSPIPSPYCVQFERDHTFTVHQPNGVIVAVCATRKTAERCAAALNACAILPILHSTPAGLTNRDAGRIDGPCTMGQCGKVVTLQFTSDRLAADFFARHHVRPAPIDPAPL